MPITGFPAGSRPSEVHAIGAAARLGQPLSGETLPPLTAVDRVALRLGLSLILWSRRPAKRVRSTDRAARAEQARLNRAVSSAAYSRDSTFQHRYQGGRTL